MHPRFLAMKSAVAAASLLLVGCATQPETSETDVSMGVMGPGPMAARTLLWVQAVGLQTSEASNEVDMTPAKAPAKPMEAVELSTPPLEELHRPPVFFLGAGDALGEQIFLTYVAALRAEEAYATGMSEFPLSE